MIALAAPQFKAATRGTCPIVILALFARTELAGQEGQQRKARKLTRSNSGQASKGGDHKARDRSDSKGSKGSRQQQGDKAEIEGWDTRRQGHQRQRSCKHRGSEGSDDHEGRQASANFLSRIPYIAYSWHYLGKKQFQIICALQSLQMFIVGVAPHLSHRSTAISPAS